MSLQRKIFIFENPHKLAKGLVSLWMEQAKNAISKRGIFTAALSGGKTPVEFYCQLGGLSEFNFWNNTFLFQVDERFVPEDDSNSNAKLIKETLLETVPIPDENVLFVDTSKNDLEEAVNAYELKIHNFFESRDMPPVFDFVLLGLGSDGHTASLFPQRTAFDIEESQMVVGVNALGIKHQRISMTLPLINQARCIIFLITGMEKADILKKVIACDDTLPASLVQPEKGQWFFYIDQYAASQLELPGEFEHHGDAISIVL